MSKLSKRFARHTERWSCFTECAKSRGREENFNLEDRSGKNSKIRKESTRKRENLVPDLCNEILNLGKKLICTSDINYRKGTRRRSSRLIRRRERRKSCVIR